MNIKKITISIVGFLCIVAGIIGIIQINIENTKALAPIGNTNSNFEIVSEEFGRDFSNFIKDNSDIKIYKEENGEYLVRLEDGGDYRVSTKSSIIENLKSIGDEIMGTLNDMKVGIENLLGK